MTTRGATLPDGRQWYLVYTKPRQERIAKTNLERQGFITYLPLMRQGRRRTGRRVSLIEPLFPRYLFIALDVERDNWAPIRSTFGVTSLVRFGLEPAVVPAGLVDALRRRDDPEGVQSFRFAGFKPGDKVRIGDGPMTGFEGIFLARTSRERVTILLDLVGRGTRVSARLGDLEPAR